MKQKLTVQTDLRPALLGRMRMAHWIEMPEKEFSKTVEELEKDPLFERLFQGREDLPSAIRRQPWPGGGFSRRLVDLNEAVASRGEAVDVEAAVLKRRELLPKIRAMGTEAFERYYLLGEPGTPIEKVAERTGVTVAEARAIAELLLELGAESEFFVPEQAPGASYVCIARIAMTDGRPTFEFFSPYWARGRYQVRYEAVEKWKREGGLTPEERRRLRGMLKRIETINLRQATLFRVLETLCELQSEFLSGGKEDQFRPISLRLLARRLDLAPSTVSRALSGRSVVLPWGEDVSLIRLLPGRRRVLREILGHWLDEGPESTDAAWAERLRKEHRIRISRRTVNAVRNELLKKVRP